MSAPSGPSSRLGSRLTVDRTLAREFETRLVESSTLAFRVAYSVLRHREDAEDVAQEAFAKAYRSFSQLRDRERFRAWLVRMTWRMALDRQRANRRRMAREDRAERRPIGLDGRPSGRPGGTRARRASVARDRRLSEKLRIVIVLAGIAGARHQGSRRAARSARGHREVAAL